MLTLTIRPYAGETDLAAIAQLFNTCDTADQLDHWTTISALREDLEDPMLDRERHSCIWENAENQIIAFAALWLPEVNEDNIVDGYLWFRVCPTVRGGDFERQIVIWGERRMREVARERNVQVRLRSSARDTQKDFVNVLQDCGFEGDRYFYRMGRSLHEPIPNPQLPEGFTIRSMQGESELEAWVELYNQSFIDHWNHHPLTVNRWQQVLHSPHYEPQLDLVAVDANGTLAAFCFCELNREANLYTGRNEGWIGDLGTRRGFRKQGLGRAMLLAGMQRLKTEGLDTALLVVDTKNPSGAMRLYESVGFCKVHTTISLVKAL